MSADLTPDVLAAALRHLIGQLELEAAGAHVLTVAEQQAVEDLVDWHDQWAAGLPPDGQAVLATAERTNAQLIAELARMGTLTKDDEILDVTWGLGRWWTLWRPDRLEGSDLNPAKSPTGTAADFTNLPWADDTFDVVALDPPYKLNGTGGSHPSDAGYGVADQWGTGWQGRHTLIAQGLTEAARVSRRLVLLKCQDQVCSGKVRWQTRIFADHGEAIGLELIDRLDVVSYRPQPAGRRQLHARRNTSTLLVFAHKGATRG